MAALLLGGTSGAARTKRGGRAPGPPLFRHPFPFRRRDAMVPRHGRMWDSTLYPKGGTGHGECDHSRQRRAGKGPESRAGAQEDQRGGRSVSRERPLRSGGDGSSGEFRGDPRNRLRQDPAASRGAQQPYDVLPRSVAGYPGGRPAAGVRAARAVVAALLFSWACLTPAISCAGEPVIREYPVPPGSPPHDVAPATDGAVWYTAQHRGELGRLDPETGRTRHIPLGRGSSPPGVIVGPDGAPWVPESGLNAIVRVDPATEKARAFPLPEG